MSKYDPLREHLARLDDVVWAAKLTDVEEILGSNLPRSAREHRTWWANSGGSLVHQNAWLDAGWRVERTDLPRNVVVFRRLRIGGTPLAEMNGRANGGARDNRSASEKQLSRTMATLRQPVTVTLRAEWTAMGEVQKVPCSESSVPASSGIIRLTTLKDNVPTTTILPASAVQSVYRKIRMAMKGEEGADCGQLDEGFAKMLNLSESIPAECDVVKPGNAWILTDGRGRKANFDDAAERDLVAQLLYIQELQSGREATLIRT